MRKVWPKEVTQIASVMSFTALTGRGKVCAHFCLSQSQGSFNAIPEASRGDYFYRLLLLSLKCWFGASLSQENLIFNSGTYLFSPCSLVIKYNSINFMGEQKEVIIKKQILSPWSQFQRALSHPPPPPTSDFRQNKKSALYGSLAYQLPDWNLHLTWLSWVFNLPTAHLSFLMSQFLTINIFIIINVSISISK